MRMASNILLCMFEGISIFIEVPVPFIVSMNEDCSDVLEAVT